MVFSIQYRLLEMMHIKNELSDNIQWGINKSEIFNLWFGVYVCFKNFSFRKVGYGWICTVIYQIQFNHIFHKSMILSIYSMLSFFVKMYSDLFAVTSLSLPMWYRMNIMNTNKVYACINNRQSKPLPTIEKNDLICFFSFSLCVSLSIEKKRRSLISIAFCDP